MLTQFISLAPLHSLLLAGERDVSHLHVGLLVTGLLHLLREEVLVLIIRHCLHALHLRLKLSELVLLLLDDVFVVT
jgi:hypothetical protein